MVRNDFAHTLAFERLGDIDPAHMRTVRGHYMAYIRGQRGSADVRQPADLPDRVVCGRTIEFTLAAVAIYSQAAAGMRSYMDDAEFREAVRSFVARNEGPHGEISVDATVRSDRAGPQGGA